MYERILCDELVPESNFVDAEHDAPYLRYRRPGKSIGFVERLEPLLNLQRLDVLRDPLAETLDEVIADIMLNDGDSVYLLRAYSVHAEVGLQLMLRKKQELNAAGGGGIIDSDSQAQSVHFEPGILVLRKFHNKSDGQGVLDSSSFSACDPEPQHPGRSFLAAYFFQTSTLISHRSSFQRGLPDAGSHSFREFGSVFFAAMAAASSASRNTHVLRLSPVPRGKAPAIPLLARASRKRRSMDRNSAASSAETNGSGLKFSIALITSPSGFIVTSQRAAILRHGAEDYLHKPAATPEGQTALGAWWHSPRFQEPAPRPGF